MSGHNLPFGPVGGQNGRSAVHLCVDMQRLFVEETPWHTPWMPRVLPQVSELAAQYPARTIFTRFIPAETPTAAGGAWRRYYHKWAQMTRAYLEPALTELVPELIPFTPPAGVFDKVTYSPWPDGRLHADLHARQIDTLVISGGETDICVLATVMGAVDLGYRVIVARDAVCSAADETHDAVLTLFARRLEQQIEVATVEDILRNWKKE